MGCSTLSAHWVHTPAGHQHQKGRDKPAGADPRQGERDPSQASLERTGHTSPWVKGSSGGFCIHSPLGFFFLKSVLVTLANRLLAGLGAHSSGAITQLLGGSFSGV